MVAGDRLMESGSALYVRHEIVKDMPVSGIVAGRGFITAVPNHPDGSGRRSGCHPRKDRGQGLRSMANLDRVAPMLSFVSRILDKDVVIVGVAGVNSSI